MIISIKEGENDTQLSDNDLMYFTIKNPSNNDDIKIQKTLENGITYNTETHKYEVEFNYIDTKELVVGKKYGYDITIYYDGNKPVQKAIGRFVLSDKYTLNEVV